MNESEYHGRLSTQRFSETHSTLPYGCSPKAMQNVERVLNRLLRSQDASEAALIERVRGAVDALNRGHLVGPSTAQSVGVDTVTRLAARVLQRLASDERSPLAEQHQLA